MEEHGLLASSLAHAHPAVSIALVGPRSCLRMESQTLTFITSSDNLSQTWPQANLICAVPQLRFLLPR